MIFEWIEMEVNATQSTCHALWERRMVKERGKRVGLGKYKLRNLKLRVSKSAPSIQGAAIVLDPLIIQTLAYSDFFVQKL